MDFFFFLQKGGEWIYGWLRLWVPVCGYFCVWKKIVCVKKKWSHWRSPVKAGCGCRGRPVRGADNLAVEMARQQGYGLPPGPPSSCRALRSRVSFPMAPRDLDPKPEILCCRAQQPFSRGVAPSKENDTSKAGRGWEDQATFAQGDQHAPLWLHYSKLFRILCQYC